LFWAWVLVPVNRLTRERRREIWGVNTAHVFIRQIAIL
jgi:hypothetical protein